MMERTLETFKRSDVPAELLKGVSYKALAQNLLFDWVIVLSCMVLMFQTSPYLYPLWVVIIAGRFHGFGVILHDLCHMNLTKKSWRLRLIEIFSGYVVGTTANAMAYHHIRHHRDTLMDTDPYYKVNKKCSGAIRIWLTFKKGTFFIPYWVTRSFVAPFALLIPVLRTPYARIFLQDVSKTDLTHHPEVRTCAIEDIPLAIFQATILFISIRYFDFMLYAFYIPLIITGIFVIYRLLIEHEYNIVSDRTIYTMIESTFDHHTRPLERILVGPNNIGYHCVHHIHPGVGLHNLPKLRDWYLERSKQYQEKYLVPKRLTWKQQLFGGIHQK